MRALSPQELLEAWERGLGQSAAERALTLLEQACPAEEPVRLPLGERDGRLLTLREWTFGPEMTAMASCPECGAAQELRFRTDEIRVPAPETAGTPLEISAGEYQLQVRLPDSLDLRAIESGSEEDSDPRLSLLERCLIGATREGENVSAAQLPKSLIEAVSERMAEADPQADIQLALECFECRRQWRAHFDIASFFWTEIQAWATRLLNEVHHLASAYGWSEAAILAMTPFRRNLYLNLIAE